MPYRLPGVRTLIAGLRRFRPDVARHILRNAMDQRCPIGVFELSQRSLLHGLRTLFVPPRFWTYVMPFVTAFVKSDALVSHVGAHSVKKLRGLADGLRGEHNLWETGVEVAPVST